MNGRTSKAIKRAAAAQVRQHAATLCKGFLKAQCQQPFWTRVRLADVATLRWEETDLERGIIRRIPTKTARRNGKPVIVPMHPALRGMLAEAAPKNRRGYVLPEIAETYRRDRSAVCKRIQEHFTTCGVTTHAPGTGFETVTDPNGKPIEKHTGKRAVVEVGFHSLRHSFVSLCRAGNAPLAVVEAIVGHASPAMTRHYTHTGEESAAAAVATLPAIIGDAPAALPPADPFKARVRALAESLNVENLESVRAELFKLVQ